MPMHSLRIRTKRVQASLNLLTNQFVVHLFHWNVCIAFFPVVFDSKLCNTDHRMADDHPMQVHMKPSVREMLQDQRQISTGILLAAYNELCKLEESSNQMIYWKYCSRRIGCI